MSRRLLTIPLTLIVLAACQPAAPMAITDAEKASIDSLEHQFMKLAIAGDFAGLVKAYYADEAIILPPNMPAATGHAGIEAVLKTFPPITAFELNTDEVVGHGDLAYVRGRYTMTFSPPGAPPIPDSGKYLEIWRKQADGSWKATRDMFSSDIPLPAPAPMPAKPAGKKP